MRFGLTAEALGNCELRLHSFSEMISLASRASCTGLGGDLVVRCRPLVVIDDAIGHSLHIRTLAERRSSRHVRPVRLGRIEAGRWNGRNSETRSRRLRDKCA